jgi:hypothetical protein
MTHAGLAQAKDQYNARPRDENGKVKTTKGKGFSLWRSLMRAESAAERRKAKAVENFRALDVDGNGKKKKNCERDKRLCQFGGFVHLPVPCSGCSVFFQIGIG